MEDHHAKQRVARTRELMAESGLSLYDARRQAVNELPVPKETSLRLRIADSTTANVVGLLVLFFAVLVVGPVLLVGCAWVLAQAIGPSASAGL
jgi:hypothetical protein